MFDLLVIGGGLAGATAALAAKRAGATVALASRSWGATAMSTGAIDIAFTPALSREYQSPRTVAEHVMDIIAHRTRHPYAVVGLERAITGIRDGYGLWRELFAGSDLELAPLDFEAENMGLPSSLGAVIPAAAAFPAHRGLDLSSPLAGTWGVVQLLGDPYFNAGRVKLGIAQDAEAHSGRAPSLVEIQLAVQARPPMAMAKALDDQKLADEVGEELRRKASGLSGLIVPPVFGLARSGEVREHLRGVMNARVVEALAHLPSVPGVRLQRQVERAIDAAGIAQVGEVVSTRVAGNAVCSLLTGDNLEITAGAYVLATGRFITGGVVWRDRCVEGLFGLPVVTEVGLMEDDSPHPVVRELPTESHPLMTAGVGVNENLQPMREGRVAYQNLFAAGNVLGGFASRYALCSDGVALATGWLAGKAAVKG